MLLIKPEKEHADSEISVGQNCVTDPDRQMVKKLGKKKGWRQCPQCRTMISRSEGCDHMECYGCGTEFCYNCGKHDPHCGSTCIESNE